MENSSCSGCAAAFAAIESARAASAAKTEPIKAIPLKEVDSLERDGWEDISEEQVREYIYPDGSSEVIYNPLLLHISESGGNRIVDQAGLSHYIMPGWNHLVFRVHPGTPFFSL